MVLYPRHPLAESWGPWWRRKRVNIDMYSALTVRVVGGGCCTRELITLRGCVRACVRVVGSHGARPRVAVGQVGVEVENIVCPAPYVFLTGSRFGPSPHGIFYGCPNMTAPRGGDGVTCLPRADLFPLNARGVQVGDRWHPSPANPAALMAATFGEDWRVPESGHRGSWG